MQCWVSVYRFVKKNRYIGLKKKTIYRFSFQAVEVIEDDSEKALPRAIRQVAAAAPLLGAATLDPVYAIGKQEFGFEAGDVLKLKYIDPKPLQGFKQFLNEIFTCKV